MPQTRTAPATDHTATTTAPTPVELSLEERLTLVNAAMTLRLDEAAVAYEVNTAHIPTEPVDLGDIVTVPLTPTLQPPPHPHPTPVAALLQRAHHRLVTDGWCSGTLLDAEGARCLYGAIRAEARGDQSLESRGLGVLMDAIRRQFDDVDSVPGFNDAWGNGRIPMRMLDQAAGLADARGL
ncbi:hypothetical protein OOK39_44965 [Streptomyces sp. NBC_00264]|uniref:DUF6197 family protein n=1 Tax=unclassified Streptomyces TaxID=2593676 RepID=UPI002256607B|nr:MULTISPECIES: hypothetical protein [unclassified Streptomyces]MCX5166191.1 hypothetical protein [Streptomyces sp. NBC_00305]MCX5224708.1 hypothetical protein [Streptomyces sp. NBC_00264]